jgi:hypothetical protein
MDGMTEGIGTGSFHEGRPSVSTSLDVDHLPVVGAGKPATARPIAAGSTQSLRVAPLRWVRFVSAE